ncbi:DUF481 domain-containing protein [Sulfurimonas sp. HSL-1716]|uniref:DUF481 domain-containing protein n=1 Tax=Hydrocurvibacter sulfurireducens TaxID=3131937 RepID=UPI0031F89C41
MRLLVLLLTCLTFSYAVVSIEPVEIGKKPGVSGELEASFETTRGNTEKDEYKGGINIQYDSNESYVTWGEFTANYAEASGVKNTNKTYAHLRYIHTYLDNKDINWETFVQSETNEFTKIQERFLLGGGLRFHLLDKAIGNAFVGTGLFYEHIDYTTSFDKKEDNARANIYLSYSKKLGKDANIAYIGYYQPRIDSFDDYIISNAAELKVHVYLKLFISLKLFYNIDSKPALGVKKEDFSQTTSLIYTF